VLEKNGWQLSYIFNTHHHWDHVGGNLQLKQRTGCKIFASKADQHRIPGIDYALNDQESVSLGAHQATVMATPGHTHGHIVYHFADDALLFCGDTLFVMGCGRLFEGTAEQLWQSLQKLAALPPTTQVYCTHEYSQANGWFALRIEPENIDLQHRMLAIKQLRKNHQATVPSTIAQEKATNPFLRVDMPSIKKALAMEHSTAVSVFTELRKRKDLF
jgi:hydroxyacylglutathione hydrolase